MIRALVFDLDDTLFPEREFVHSGFRAVDEWLRNARSICGFGEAASSEFSAGARGNVFDLALRRLGVADDPVLVRKMVEVYRAHVPTIHLFEDAAWALDHFSGGMQLGLLTDGYLEVQRRKVDALGIADRFAAMVFCDEAGREAWKPSAIPYEKIRIQLQCCGNECLYIGDNPSKDFVTAKALGWCTLQICRPGGEYAAIQVPLSHQADAIIHSLAELADVLR
ncbi:MAG TPA: HAD family hydrolase [Verrucomicrobiae bacterium]